jgi:chitinase
MVSTKENRAAFIASVKTYMDTYGFQGVDLDWEYPGAPERGGNKLADTRNFSLLLKEMRAAYGTAYGISLTLAPDYWYLRWFDAKAMEPHVDFFGFMAYGTSQASAAEHTYANLKRSARLMGCRCKNIRQEGSWSS